MGEIGKAPWSESGHVQPSFSIAHKAPGTKEVRPRVQNTSVPISRYGPHPLGGGAFETPTVEGREFWMRPRLLNTNSIKESGVKARLIYTMLLPHDELEYFVSTRDQLNAVEQYLVTVRKVLDFLLILFLLLL